MHVLSAVLKERKPMRIVMSIIGVLLILAGGVWFLQGISVLPGSIMTGQTQWAVYGGLAVLVGAGLLLYVNRRMSR
jgi:LPXTG-motif cell wall-anchored protein